MARAAQAAARAPVPYQHVAPGAYVCTYVDSGLRRRRVYHEYIRYDHIANMVCDAFEPCVCMFAPPFTCTGTFPTARPRRVSSDAEFE